MTNKGTIRRRSGNAPSFGWLRRPELDTATVDAWEKPDGQLYAAEIGHVPIIVKVVPYNAKDRTE